MVFLFTETALFEFMGITSDDFRIGGGVVLLVLSIQDLAGTSSEDSRRKPKSSVGVVPIGIPLMMGTGRAHDNPHTRRFSRCCYHIVRTARESAHRPHRTSELEMDYSRFGRGGLTGICQSRLVVPMVGIVVIMIRSGLVGMLSTM